MSTYECLMPHCRAAVYDYRACCDDCWEDRRGQLTSLPDLYVMTYVMMTPGARQQDITDIHVPALDPAAPINLVAYDTLVYGYQRLAAWAALAHQMAGWGQMQPARNNSGAAFLRVVRTLGTNDHRFALQNYAGGYVLDVWTAYRRMVVQCVSTEPRHLNVACPECESATVVTRHADEYAMCLTCGNSWPHSQMPMLRRRTQRTAP